MSAVVERFDDEAFNKKNLDIVDELMSDDVVIHASEAVIQGRDSWKRFLRRLFAAFLDCKSATEFMITEDDRIAAGWTAARPAPFVALKIDKSPRIRRWSSTIAAADS
jgi:hypothetical protein